MPASTVTVFVCITQKFVLYNIIISNTSTEHGINEIQNIQKQLNKCMTHSTYN